jgi:hypothetical protein
VDDAARGESRTAAEGSCDTTPIPTFAVSRRVADRLLAGIGKTAGELEADIGADGRPRSAAVPGVTLRVSAKAIVSTARNVVFVRRGTDALLRDEAVLVCAHTDHLGRGPAGCDSTQAGQVHNGADDNASGTAAMIEVAEALAAGPPTKRSVVFAGWCAEERGLLGSEAFAGHPLWDLTRIAVVVNMDMVGRYRDAQPGDAGLTVGGMPTAAEVAAPMSRLAAVHGLRLTPSWQFFEQSDQFSFYRRGVPSLLLHTGLHADYHRAGDDWWKVEAEPGARIARLVLDLTRELADSPQRPQFAKRPPKPVVGARADDAAGGGVRLSEVLPGLGAAAAGLRAGDVVVALGGKEIEDVRDYHSFLGCAATGDVVEFVFLRDGKKLTASVRLAARD